ncbi:MAG: glycine cleavage system aminomethyltransferase GcvT [Ignavibacteriaceae bacterium]
MKKTKFYNIHKKLGAKIVDFAGYLMPVQYSSIIAEHKAVRNSVGVFDVSHMGEIFVEGEKALDFVQQITINDASKLFPGRVQYSAMCYADGGIVDDLLVYKISDTKFMLVVNASNIEKDFNWMSENLSKLKSENNFNVELNNLSDDYSLLAVQGPHSKNVVKKLCEEELNLEYYHFIQTKISGFDMIVSRTGYTGEIGYELYFKGGESTAEKIWNKLFEAGNEFGIQPIGLGARDTLRLEMGFCLYGNDIDKTTNPLEAGLGWITKLKKENFIGKDKLEKIKAEGLKRKLSAFTTDEKAFPRHGYEITKNGKKIGNITSGTVSPILEKPIALGYVDIENSAEDNEINFLIREKEIPAKIVKLPFIKK